MSETGPPFSPSQDDDNVVPPNELLRLREARFAERYLRKLAHPAYIASTISLLNPPADPEEGEERELFDLVYSETPSYPADPSDPLEHLFQHAFDKVRTSEQHVALNALRHLHNAARYRAGDSELSHVRALVSVIVGIPRPPQGPQSVA